MKNGADMDRRPDEAWIAQLPKTDLHCHLGGSLRLSTIRDEADRQGIALPGSSVEDLAARVIRPDAASLEEYLEAFDITESVLKDAQALERAAYELVEDAHRENVRLLEIRYAPTNYRTENLKLFQIVEAVLAGIKRGREKFGTLVGLILCGPRQDRAATAEAARLAADYRRSGVIGFDLAGPERGYRPKTYESILEPVFASFIPVTMHAGEAYGAKSIGDAINCLNARRIGHATNLFELGGLTDYIEIIGLGLEVCLSSNLHTGAVPSIQSHPVRQMVRRGLRVSVNTDNRLVSDTTITKEMGLLVSELGFTKRDLVRMVKDGVKSSFFRKWEKGKLLDEIDVAVAEMEGDTPPT